MTVNGKAISWDAYCLWHKSMWDLLSACECWRGKSMHNVCSWSIRHGRRHDRRSSQWWRIAQRDSVGFSWPPWIAVWILHARYGDVDCVFANTEPKAIGARNTHLSWRQYLSLNWLSQHHQSNYVCVGSGRIRNRHCINSLICSYFGVFVER